jgi:hypothetical protein
MSIVSDRDTRFPGDFWTSLLLHIKNTHFDSVASVVITKVASVAFCSQGRKCHVAHKCRKCQGSILP